MNGNGPASFHHSCGILFEKLIKNGGMNMKMYNLKVDGLNEICTSGWIHELYTLFESKYGVSSKR